MDECGDKGLSSLNAASPTPTASTAMVPAKFCQMMARVRRAITTVSTNFTRSLPSSTTSALSRATSVPEPIVDEAAISRQYSLLVRATSTGTTQPCGSRKPGGVLEHYGVKKYRQTPALSC